MSAGAPAAIRFARRNASHGALWLRRAFAMLSQHRVRWLLLLLAYYVIIVSIDLVPIVGAFVAPLLKPVFAVGFLAAAWSQERGEPPAIGQLFRGFRSDLRALLLLGAVFVVGMTAAVVATSFVDGGKLLEVLAGAARPDEAFVGRGEVQIAMLFGALCALPVVLALWFAPALVVFQDCGGRSRARDEPARGRRELAPDRRCTDFSCSSTAACCPAFVAKVIAALVPLEAAQAILCCCSCPIWHSSSPRCISPTT